VERQRRSALSRPSHPAPTFRDDRPKRPSDLEQDGHKDAFDLAWVSSDFPKIGIQLGTEMRHRTEMPRQIGSSAQRSWRSGPLDPRASCILRLGRELSRL